MKNGYRLLVISASSAKGLLKKRIEEHGITSDFSVWIGGSCRKYRVGDGVRVPSTERYGWVVMGASVQYDLLGLSISEALPENVTLLISPPCKMCEAEMAVQTWREASNESSKRQKTK